MNMTDAQVALAAILALAALGAVMADGYTTMIGLEHGFKEGNPLMRWVFGKIGQSLALFLSAVAVLFIGGAVSNISPNATSEFFGIIAAAEGTVAVQNYLKLKAAKISLK